LALLRWFKEPQVGSEVNRKNFLFVQIDAIGIGLANAAAPFLPVFLTRLGATNLLALVIGGYLQRKSNIVPWFGTARLLVVLSYALTGIAPFIVPRQYLVFVILAIWALATLPQTIVSILFSVVMNTVAGPEGRFELMSRRWSIMGFTSAITVVIVGQVLDRLGFPFNYQLVFMVLSIGGLISFYFSSHLDLPVRVIPVITLQGSKSQRLKEYWKLIFSQKPFINFALRRFVYLTGVSLAAPLFPLYFVRQLHASDAWIGLINTSSTAVMIVGYFFWVRRSRKHGTRMVLLWTTLGLSLYPFLVAITGRVEVVVLLAGMAGIFQAGLDLIFFDELLRTIPFAQSMQYLSAVVSPIIGTFLADTIGISGGLIVAAAIRLLGFVLFLTQKKQTVIPTTPGAA
jgi:hypothetical protein